MIKFEEKVQPPKIPEKQNENRFDQVNEAALEKRKKAEITDPNSSHSSDKNKES